MLSIESPNIIYLLQLVSSLLSQASTIVKDMSFGYHQIPFSRASIGTWPGSEQGEKGARPKRGVWNY